MDKRGCMTGDAGEQLRGEIYQVRRTLRQNTPHSRLCPFNRAAAGVMEVPVH